jgi:hypothetical protein
MRSMSSRNKRKEGDCDQRVDKLKIPKEGKQKKLSTIIKVDVIIWI